MENRNTKDQLHFGIVGKGQVAAMHLRAVALEGHASLVAGCFSRNQERNQEQAALLGISEERLYGSFGEMAKVETSRPEPIDFVIVTTPNNSHFEIASAFLAHGIPVLCEKPLTTSLEHGKALAQTVSKTNGLLCVNYTYSGYPMLQQARRMVNSGLLGTIIRVVVDFQQDRQYTTSPASDDWRKDPLTAGAGCTADIGVHAWHLASMVTGLKAQKLSAVFSREPANLPVETDVCATVRYQGGATGVIIASKTSIGHHCDITLRVYGTLGSLEWSHSVPQKLIFAPLGEPIRIYSAANPYLCPEICELSRLSSGHMEGLHDAQANIYHAFIKHILDRKHEEERCTYNYPTEQDGLDGVRFLDACLRSVREGSQWVDFFV